MIATAFKNSVYKSFTNWKIARGSMCNSFLVDIMGHDISWEVAVEINAALVISRIASDFVYNTIYHTRYGSDNK